MSNASTIGKGEAITCSRLPASIIAIVIGTTSIDDMAIMIMVFITHQLIDCSIILSESRLIVVSLSSLVAVVVVVPWSY